MQTTSSQVARIDVQADTAMPSHTTSDQYESQGDVPTVLLPGMNSGFNEEEPEEGIPDEAAMDDYRPDIFLIDLPHSDVVPTEYLWRQCAVFMVVKKSAWYGPLSNDPSMHGCTRTRVWSSLVRRSAGVWSPKWRIMLEF